jgi:hypothetical protein
MNELSKIQRYLRVVIEDIETYPEDTSSINTLRVKVISDDKIIGLYVSMEIFTKHFIYRYLFL